MSRSLIHSAVVSGFALGMLAGCGQGMGPAVSPETASIAQQLRVSPAVVAAATDPKTGKVTICHYPPGNRANAHTITVGAPAVVPHVRQHRDTLGPCKLSDGGLEAPVNEGDSSGTPGKGEGNPAKDVDGSQDAGSPPPPSTTTPPSSTTPPPSSTTPTLN